MPIAWPYSLDVLVDPTASDKTNSSSVPHAEQHANLNNIVEALELKVGLSDSGVAGSSAPSTMPGDVFYVADSSGRTQYGPAAMALLAAYDGTSTGVAAVTFSGIRQDFGGLLITSAVRSTSSGTFGSLNLQFNNDTAANYRAQNMQGGPSTSISGSESLGSTSLSVGFLAASTAQQTAAGIGQAFVNGYTSTALEKTVNSLRGVFYASTTNAARINFYHGSWQSTAAVTGLTFFLNLGGFAVGSRIRVYGLPD